MDTARSEEMYLEHSGVDYVSNKEYKDMLKNNYVPDTKYKYDNTQIDMAEDNNYDEDKMFWPSAAVKERIIHDREHSENFPYTYNPSSAPGPLQYGKPLSGGIDPGVIAVSSALFERNSAFKAIPIGIQRKHIFRRRKKNDVLSEWSNAFTTTNDACGCQSPEVIYDPYKVFRFRNQDGIVTSSAYNHYNQ